MRPVFIAAALIALVGLVSPASAQTKPVTLPAEVLALPSVPADAAAETPAAPAWKVQTCKQGPEQFPVCKWIDLPATSPKPVVRYYVIMESTIRASADLSAPLPAYINRDSVLVVAHGSYLMHHTDGTIFPENCLYCYRLTDKKIQIGARDLSQDGIMKSFVIVYLDYPRLEAPTP